MTDSDLATVALLELLNGCESGIIAARQCIKEAKLGDIPQTTWNPDKIKWTPAEGPSGPYERTEDVNSLDFKAMLKELAAHQGKLTRDDIFYWTFKNGITVGRKNRTTQDPKP